EALQARVEAFKDGIAPRNPLEDYLVERAACVSWQLDRADRTIAARLTERMHRGPADRAAAEADAVAELGLCLFEDPRGPIALYPPRGEGRSLPRISCPRPGQERPHPARIVARLEATATGCRWLLDRWAELTALLERGLTWQPPDRLKAIRMLGAQPLDAADDERVLAVYLACDGVDP